MAKRTVKPKSPAEARRRLRRALQRLPPERFDYRFVNCRGETCGCVARVWDRLLLRWGMGLCTFGLMSDENAYLIGRAVRHIGPGKGFTRMTHAEATGRAGLAEALRRLAIVDARATAREREGRA
jgi:hypothetical protein